MRTLKNIKHVCRRRSQLVDTDPAGQHSGQHDYAVNHDHVLYKCTVLFTRRVVCVIGIPRRRRRRRTSAILRAGCVSEFRLYTRELQPSYWRGVFNIRSNKISSEDGARAMRAFSLASAVSSGAGDEPDDKDKPDLTAFEEVDSSAAQPYVILDNLTRVFGRGRARFVAVDHLSMYMHERQVTALLGHNGAGKSTTVHMLTGMLAPTSGTALVGGFDLRTQLSDIRRLIGVCPQYNVLFDKLTVAEHLYFF